MASITKQGAGIQGRRIKKPARSAIKKRSGGRMICGAWRSVGDLGGRGEEEEQSLRRVAQW
jgi:hypothetical protein